MTYRKLERITLWFLTITMIVMFCVSEWANSSCMNLNESLLDTVDSNRQYYDEVIEEYRTQIEDLKVENVKLKMQIEEMEEE